MLNLTSLPTEIVESIFSAISIAECEVGEGWEDVKLELYKQYPSVKKAHDKRVKDDNAEWDKQTKARKKIAKKVFDELKIHKPIVPQVLAWFKDEKYTELNKHYSDDICLSADLFKYHIADLKKIGLLDEIRSHLKSKGQKTENYWMKDHWKTTQDENLWHELTGWNR